MQSQRINLVRNAIEIQTTRGEKKIGIKGKEKLFLTKEKAFWKKI